MIRHSIRSILVGVDLHAESEAVVLAAGEIAARAGAELHLLYAFDLQPLPYTTEDTGAVGFQARIAEARAALDTLARRTLPASVPVASREVVIYVAHKAILDRAAQVGADLIVLGGHRNRGIGDRFLGTTADRVVRSADVPCLIVPDGLSLPLRRILAPIDLSEPARAALDLAIDWAASFGGPPEEPGGPEVRVFHVIPRVFDIDDLPLERGAGDPDLRREIEQALARAGGTPGVEVRQEVVWAVSPADEIVQYARHEGIDLIVLGTHGYGALKRALIGSVASAVLRDSPGPVLVVPPRVWASSD